MVQEIKDELDQMEETGVIKKVTEPTEWVSSLVYARKQSGKLRICLDPRDLNKVIMRPHYPTKNLEDVSYKLKCAKIFSKLDARQGYWAIHLDHESILKTTFNSPHGRYRFMRLPFGLNLSQDVFQLKMDMIIENCPGTLGIADDIAVFGKNEEEHDANLHHLMTCGARACPAPEKEESYSTKKSARSNRPLYTFLVSYSTKLERNQTRQD